MLEERTIIFTGGGSAGHVTPNLAIIAKCQKENWRVFYIGSKNGIEREIINKTNIKYFSILSGKLRRYFSWQNFIDPFKILIAIIQAFFICRKIKPQVIFSKGGFVALPVVVAGWLNRIPVIIHESDLTPGLANKLSFPFAKTICVTFAATKNYIKNSNKVVVTGTPIRAELFNGDAKKGRELCGFNDNKKIIFVFSGSLGSAIINKTIRALLPKLLVEFNVAHICGNNQIDRTINLPGYKQFAYLYDEMADVFACANIVISRAGANTIYELLSLRKPHILIPLSKAASRGDQILNANYFAKQNYSQVIPEEELTPETLDQKIIYVNTHEAEIVKRLQDFPITPSTELIYQQFSNLSVEKR